MNAGISGGALLITAIVEMAKHQLSLYHAIFILHILVFTGAATVLASPGKDKTINLSTIPRRLIGSAMAFGFIVYSIYIWAKAPTFGNSPGCNHEIKYIYFFFSVRATVVWLRIYWIANFGILGLSIYLYYIAMPLIYYAISTSRRPHSMSSRVPISIPRGPTPTRSWRSMASRVLPFQLWIVKALNGTYGVVMLELYVRRNRHLLGPGEQNWTFGQILALTQIIGMIHDIYNYLVHERSESGWAWICPWIVPQKQVLKGATRSRRATI